MVYPDLPGLTEIPEDCALTEAINWALNKAPGISNYREARESCRKKI